MGPDGAEEIADRTLGCPGAETDSAAGAQDPGDLVGDDLVAGREHAAERGEDHVEPLVGQRQVFGVALDPLDPAAAARCRPDTSISGVRSRPVTRAPARAAGIVAFPVPHATSSTSSSVWPARTNGTGSIGSQ